MSRAQTLWICGGSLVLLALLGGRALVQVGHGLERTWSTEPADVEAQPRASLGPQSPAAG